MSIMHDRFAAALADRLDPPDPDVFGALGYIPTPKQQIFHEATEWDVLFGGAAGGGKGGRCPDRSLPDYDPATETRVVTPKGFKLIGDVTPGDQVCNPDGTVARVLRVTDNGAKQFYRVTLADGASVEADEDHLWAITVAGKRKRRKHEAPYIPPGLRPEDEWNLRAQSRCRIVTTVQLRALVDEANSERAAGRRPYPPQLPLPMPVNLTGAKGRWERLSPYVLGALIGDGHFGDRSVVITGVDPEIFERIAAELPDHLRIGRLAGESHQVPAYSVTRKALVADEAATAAFTSELATLLERKGWRQRDLMAATGSNQAYISCIARGTKRPSHAYAERLDGLLDAGGSLLAAHGDFAGVSASDMLARDGLVGCRSWDKFIPDRIKYGPADDRFSFLQGLFDTDGTMDTRGHTSFTTVSERLASDAREVLRSLGYTAKMATETPWYHHNGEKRAGRLAYTLYVRGRHLEQLFHLARKRERAQKYNGGDVEPFHRVVSVEPSGTDNSRCIQVDNLNQLYLTDDYIVTHNSRAITAEIIRACVKYPGIRVGAFRRTFGELRDSVITELAKMDFAQSLGATWNGSDYELRFPGGSLAMFRYAESMKDATRRQGGEYQLLAFDERTLTPASVCEFLETRLRSGRPDIPVLGIRSTANPGGVGHGEVKKRYITPTAYGTKTVTDKRGRVTRFIPSRLADNPHMNAEYGGDLSVFSAEMRAAFMDGNWDLVSGAMWPELGNRDRYVVEPFTLPQSWKRYCGVDWGFYPGFWAVIWGAEDEDGRIWLYRELYQQRVIEPDQAKMILAAEAAGEHIAVRYADDAMWTGRGAAKSSADMYADEGVHLTKAEKGSRVIGWQRVGSYIAEKPACQHHRSLGWSTCPMLHMFPALEHTFRTLTDLQHATKGDPEDADTTGEDHLPDALRYMLINLGTGPGFPILGDLPGESSDLLHPLGSFAIRPPDDGLPFHMTDADDDEPRATVQSSPFA